MSWIDQAIKRARDYDTARPRSLQRAVGWSEVGGCRAAIGYRLDGAFTTDDTDTWAAQRGTAIHEYLEPVIADPDVRTEVDTIYRGIPGHADLVGPDYLVDLKTKTLANAKLWQNDISAMRQARVQVHGYAAGLVDAGDLPADCKIRILVIPVDGTFADWWCYEETFDRALADEGADRLEDVRARLAAGEDLPRDKPYVFCESYCPYFSLCRDPKTAHEAEQITDPELAAAVARYGEINAILNPLEKEKKGLAVMIRGLRGTAGDWKVSTGEPGEDKEVIDEDAIWRDYEERGAQVPMTVKPGNAPRLTVTKIKAPAAKTPKAAA
jgi:hypothetical protein